MHHVFLPYILGVLSTITILVGGYAVKVNIDDFRNINKPIVYQAPVVERDIKMIEAPTTTPKLDVLADEVSSSTLEMLSVLLENAKIASSSQEEVPVAEEIVIVEIETEAEVQVNNLEIEQVSKKVEPIVEEVVQESLNFGEINTNTREALVNILCTARTAHAAISPISGSGVLVDPRGVILTNAHIAQSLLLEDTPTEGFLNCVVRTGSPARATYDAKVLYMSSQWAAENYDNLIIENPTGTGENDFALLLITESLTANPLPASFPYIQPGFNDGDIVAGQDILVAAYPAGFLGGKTISKDLYAASSVTTVGELFTFVEDETAFRTLDLISLGGTVIAQQGSSGGAVVNKYGNLIALISTSSWGETTADRDLRGITLTHINRSLAAYNDTTLDNLLSGNLLEKALAFEENTAPNVLKILLSSFSNN